MNMFTNPKRITAGICLAIFLINTSPLLATSAQRYSQGTVTWKPVAGASYYNLYYKEAGGKKYAHAVSGIPAGTTSYVIRYLKRRVPYTYQVAAVDGTRKEFSMSNMKWITAIFQK